MIRGRWCGIFLNARVRTEDKRDDTTDHFYEQLDRLFYHFHKQATDIKILLGDFDTKVG